MTSLSDKLALFDEQQFNIDNEGLVEFMRGQLTVQIVTAINDGKVFCSQIEQFYKQYYQNGFTMDDAFRKEYKRLAHTTKGQAKMCYVQKMYEHMSGLQKAVENGNRNDIDKYMYEVFAFKKKYFECLYAIKGDNVDEPEFDLRQFDEFTHLNLAPVYQSIPINSKSLTFNQIGNSNIVNNNEMVFIGNSASQNSAADKGKKRVMISETVNEKVEIIKPVKENEKPPNGEEQNGLFISPGDIKVNDSPESLYAFSKLPREKGDQIYIYRRPQISYEDLPIDPQFMCSIF